jgi:hypothetical protein
MDEEVIECTYNPPGPKVGDVVEIVKLEEQVQFLRSLPSQPIIGAIGVIFQRIKNNNGSIRYRVEFDNLGCDCDFSKSEFKKK